MVRNRGSGGTLRRGLAFLVVCMLLVPSAGIVAADVVGSPDLDTYTTDRRVTAGETTPLTVSVVNTGEVDEGSATNPSLHGEVTTARGAVLRLEPGDAPIEVQSGPVAVGSIPSGSAVPGTFSIRVDEGAAPGTYEVPVNISYQFTHRVERDGTPEERTKNVTRNVTIEVTEQAQFTLVEADTDAAVGGSGQVSVTLRNTGSGVAEDATVTLRSGTGDLTFGPTGAAETFTGDWAPGTARTFTVGADVARSATLRALPLSTTVSWTDSDDSPAEERISLGVVPDTESRLGVDAVETTAASGDSGEVTFTLTNDGDRNLTDATVRLTSSNPGLTFGGAGTTTAYVGDWAAGETTEVTVEAAFARGVEQRPFPVDATVAYTGTDGRDANTAPVTVGVIPADEQSFDVVNASTSLRVGTDGSLEGTLVNEGPGAVENAVLVLQPTGSTIDAVEREYALGDLEAGESSSFAFDVSVASGAKDGPRQFTYRVEYEGSDDDRTQSDPLYVRGEVAPQRDVFDVSVEAGSFEPGESGAYTLTVTNAGDETVSDVSAKLFADAPVSATDDEAFIDSLEPGESTTLRFGVGVAGSATAKPYPLSVDFQYTEPDGDTKLSDSYRVPVSVEEASGGGLFGLGVSAGVVVAALVLVGLVAVLWVRR
jgi:hypothetical protein